MRILHINTGQAGGAAWCAMRISKALINNGVDSRMLFAEGKSLPDGVEGAIAEPDKVWWISVPILRGVLFRLLPHLPYFMNQMKMQRLLNEANDTHLYVHQPFSKYKNIAHHPLVEWADIVHLHWVPEFVDYPTFFKEVKKPIVWTLHDHFPAVGVLHFNSEFYPVTEKLQSMDSYCRKIKRKGVSKAFNLNVVALSEMMFEKCHNSDVLQGFPVTLIHNGVDTTIFRPYNRQESRKLLGLLPDAKIFLFSSYSINDQRKGLDRAIAALEKTDIPNKLFVCIGNIPFNVSVPEASFPVIVTGGLNNQTKIARYYSAADLFLQCSYEETFVQTPLEAMACGTPVISTPCSGAKDLIRPFNGVICNGYDPDSLCEGIMTAMTRKYDPVQIRNHIVEYYDSNIIATQYIELYKSIITDTSSD